VLLGCTGGNKIDLTSAEWGYTIEVAADNNIKGLGALECKDFPGVILPVAGACAIPTEGK
jgi:hypothetical protein